MKNVLRSRASSVGLALGALALVFGGLTAAAGSTAAATPTTVSPVGSKADAQGSGVSSVSVSPKTAGDALVLLVKISSATVTVASVNGGGASWAKVGSYEDASAHDLEVWLGTVTATGASTIGLAYSGSPGSSSIELVSQEFTAGLGSASVWSKDVAAGQSNPSSATVASPTLSATNPGELYVSYARSPGQVLSGSTPGVTYAPTTLGNMVLFDPSVTGTLSPTSQNSPAGTSSSIGALIGVSATSLPPPPTVSALSPSSGPSTGGTTVTVTGTNFASGNSVSFGGTAATGITVGSGTSLTATAPPGAGTVDVTVTGPGGTSTTSPADRYTYTAPIGPTLIQSASAGAANAQVGTSVPITVALASACRAGDTLIAMVTIGQNPGQGGAVSAVPSGWQRLFEHSPTDNSPYQGWFALSNCAGVSAVMFTVSAPTDSSGTTGTVVVSEFSGLPSKLAVDFDVNDGRGEAENTANLPGMPTSAAGELVLTALSFYGNSGSSTTPSGWSLAGAQAGNLPAFVYTQPSSSSTPDATFNWAAWSPYEVTMVALKAASVSENVGQESQASFNATTSASATLSQGVAGGDALVALVGTDAPGVTVSSVTGGGVLWQRANSGSQPGNGTLEDWVGFGSAGTAGATTVTVPLSGPADGHLLVSEIAGVGGLDTSQVASGTGTTASGVALAGAPGDLQVASVASFSSSVVVHPEPQWSTYSLSAVSFADEWLAGVSSASPTPSWLLSNSAPWLVVQLNLRAGTAVPPPAPTVSAVSPASGASTGGTPVTVTGTNFGAGDTVSFGGVAATGVTVGSASALTSTAPAGTGTVDVTVTGPGGTSAITASDRYTYTTAPPAAPSVNSISPASGPAAGGGAVTVTGANFASSDTVSFGGVAATGVTVGSTTSLTATAPAGTGTVDVTVTGPGGASATTAADRYTYTTAAPAAPTVTAVGAMADGTGTGLSSLAVNPATVGDALVLTVRISAASATVTSVTGGGANWIQVGSYQDSTSSGLEIWLGTVTATGPSTLSVGYSSSVSSSGVELVAQEFTAGLGSASVWTKDVAAGQTNPSSATIASPSLSAASAGELYVGYSRSPGQVLAGSTPGVTYDPTALGNMFLFDPSVTGTLAPASQNSPAGTSSAIGALIAVS